MVVPGHRYRPFFTIAVPTYNRHDLLRETLHSILAQDFADFEVIVGNDYTAEVLTGDLLCISDPRVRFVNHPLNLREVGNMNALLGLARGRYFTWLFDDDLYHPDFLARAYDSLTRTGYPPALFPSFRVLWESERFQPGGIVSCPESVFGGREFLRSYFSGRLKITSTSGLFSTCALREVVGPLEELCPSAIGLYSEFLFLARCALLERIGFMDAPLVLMRAHTGSWSESNLELDKYLEAGQNLVRRCGQVLRHPALSDDFGKNLMGICRLHLYTYAYKAAKLEIARGGFGPLAAWRAMSRLAREHAATRRTYAAEAGSSRLATRLLFLPTQAKHAVLILGTLAVHWGRTIHPGFLKRSCPELGV